VNNPWYKVKKRGRFHLIKILVFLLFENPKCYTWSKGLWGVSLDRKILLKGVTLDRKSEYRQVSYSWPPLTFYTQSIITMNKKLCWWQNQVLYTLLSLTWLLLHRWWNICTPKMGARDIRLDSIQSHSNNDSIIFSLNRHVCATANAVTL